MLAPPSWFWDGRVHAARIKGGHDGDKPVRTRGSAVPRGWGAEACPAPPVGSARARLQGALTAARQAAKRAWRRQGRRQLVLSRRRWSSVAAMSVGLMPIVSGGSRTAPPGAGSGAGPPAFYTMGITSDGTSWFVENRDGVLTTVGTPHGAFTEALSRLPATGGHIHAGFEGTWEFAAGVSVNKPCLITGNGKASLIKHANSSTFNAFTIASDDVHFRDVAFDGNQANLVDQADYAQQASIITDTAGRVRVSVTACYFTNHVRAAIHMRNTGGTHKSQGPIIEKCWFVSGGTQSVCVYFGAAGEYARSMLNTCRDYAQFTVIKDGTNTFIGPGNNVQGCAADRGAIEFGKSGETNFGKLQIFGNNITHVSGYGITNVASNGANQTFGSRVVRIMDNMVGACGKHGLYLKDCSAFFISGTFANNGTETSNTWDHIHLDTLCQDNLLVALKFDDNNLGTDTARFCVNENAAGTKNSLIDGVQIDGQRTPWYSRNASMTAGGTGTRFGRIVGVDSFVAKTGAATVNPWESRVTASGTFTLTLPGMMYDVEIAILNVGTGTVTLDAGAGNTIGVGSGYGTQTITLTEQGQAVTLKQDRANARWLVV